MSYSTDALDDRGLSILTQVAFKGAIDLSKDLINPANPDDQAAFALAFSFLTEALIDGVKASVGASRVGASGQTDGADIIHANFPGTVEVQGEAVTLKVRGQQYGPIPEWMISAAAADGTTEVYDNRDQLAANPKRPWFRSTADKDKAYWPPKKGR